MPTTWDGGVGYGGAERVARVDPRPVGTEASVFDDAAGTVFNARGIDPERKQNLASPARERRKHARLNEE